MPNKYLRDQKSI